MAIKKFKRMATKFYVSLDGAYTIIQSMNALRWKSQF